MFLFPSSRGPAMQQLNKQFLFAWSASSEIMLFSIKFLFFNSFKFCIKWDYIPYSTMSNLCDWNAQKVLPWYTVFLCFFYWHLPSGKKKAKKDDVYTWLQRIYAMVLLFPAEYVFATLSEELFWLLLMSWTFHSGVKGYFEGFCILPHLFKFCHCCQI